MRSWRGRFLQRTGPLRLPDGLHVHANLSFLGRSAVSGTRARCLTQSRSPSHISSCRYASQRAGNVLDDNDDAEETLTLRYFPSKEQATHISSWLARVEQALPSELQRPGLEILADHAAYTPRVIARILVEARRSRGFDVLVEFGREGRWAALLWMIDYLVRGLSIEKLKRSWELPQWPLNDKATLEDAVSGHVDLARPSSKSDVRLDRLVSRSHPLGPGPGRRLTQDFLGLGEVWQSIGNLIIEDAARQQGSIRPEILEIIARLHHLGLMPDSTYAYDPLHSGSAGNPPPTLHLLLPQILAALSDAACNSHIQSSANLTSSIGSRYARRHPQQLHVTSLSHEIWLELMLWACLHGGWISSGASILETLIKQDKPRWSPLSWRELVSPMIKVEDESSIDWTQMAHLFTARNQVSPTDDKDTPRVRRTISSDVISAYVVAIVDNISTGVGTRGIRIGQAVTLLGKIKQFLRMHNFGLESTSWDVILQRLLESEGAVLENAPGIGQYLLALSPSYHEDKSVQNLPTRDEAWRSKTPYGLDGSAMSLGVSHRVLSTYIKRGDSAAAFRTFRALQNRTDENKRASLAEFFEEQKSRSFKPFRSPLDFRSHAGTDAYPSMFTMLPRDVMAPLLDLVCDVRAYEFGHWLIASQDVDGPTVTPIAYKDPRMLSAMIRFAAASRDQDLLSRLLTIAKSDPQQEGFPPSILFAIMDSQLQLNNAEAALKTLAAVFNVLKPNLETTEVILALLAKEVIQNSQCSPKITARLSRLLAGDQSVSLKVRHNIAAVLSCVSDTMRSIIRSSLDLSGQITAIPNVKAFNRILEGVVARSGSMAGRELLCQFYRPAQSIMRQETGLELTVGRLRPGVVEAMPDNGFSFDVRLPEVAIKTRFRPESTAEFRGRFTPDLSTLRIIIGTRLQELLDSGISEEARLMADAEITWGKGMLAVMGRRNVEREIRSMLPMAGAVGEEDIEDGDQNEATMDSDSASPTEEQPLTTDSDVMARYE